MCGLVGVAGRITAREEKVLDNLLIMDQLRGFHSVGVAGVDSQGKAAVLKKAINVVDFLDMKSYSKLVRHSDNILLGHNRWATQGAVNSVNAHPFRIGSVVGAHNGTLKNQNLLPDSHNFEVDSENIFHSINKIGIENTHKNLHGAYALTWWNEEDNKLRIVRNKERTLYHCYSEDMCTMYWASEKYMLLAALERNKVQHTAPEMFPEHVLHTFDIPLMPNFSGTQAIPKPRVKKLAAYEEPPAKKPQTGTGRTKSRGSVVPIGGKTRPVPKALREWGYDWGSEIEYYLTHTSGHYLRGYTWDDKCVAVKLYCPNHKEVEKLMAHEGNFLVKGILDFDEKDKEEASLRLSLHNSEAIPEQPNKNIELFVSDHNGVIINRDTFEKRYSKGCCWCGHPVAFEMQDYTILDDCEVIHNECCDAARPYIN